MSRSGRSTMHARSRVVGGGGGRADLSGSTSIRSACRQEIFEVARAGSVGVASDAFLRTQISCRVANSKSMMSQTRGEVCVSRNQTWSGAPSRSRRTPSQISNVPHIQHCSHALRRTFLDRCPQAGAACVNV